MTEFRLRTPGRTNNKTVWSWSDEMEWIAGDEGEISAWGSVKDFHMPGLYDLSGCDGILKRAITRHQTYQIVVMNLPECAKERVTMGCNTHVS
jgi:hypothetical protein